MNNVNLSNPEEQFSSLVGATADVVESLLRALSERNGYRETEKELRQRCTLDREGEIVTLDLSNAGLSGRLDLQDYTRRVALLDVSGNRDVSMITVNERSPLAQNVRAVTAGAPINSNLTADRTAGVDFAPATGDATLDSINRVDEANRSLELAIGEIADTIEAERPVPDRDGYMTARREIEKLARQREGMHREMVRLKAELDSMDKAIEQIEFAVGDPDRDREVIADATIGAEFAAVMQERVEQTEIGVFGRGLKNLKRMGEDFNSPEYMAALTKAVKDSLPRNVGEKEIAEAARAKAKELWGVRDANLKTAEVGLAYGKDMALAVRNFGREGLKEVKATKREYKAAEREVNKTKARNEKKDIRAEQKIAQLEEQKAKIEKKLQRKEKRVIRRGRRREWVNALLGRTDYNVRQQMQLFDANKYKLDRSNESADRDVKKSYVLIEQIKQLKAEKETRESELEAKSLKKETKEKSYHEAATKAHREYIEERIHANLDAFMAKCERDLQGARDRIAAYPDRKKDIAKLEKRKEAVIKKISSLDDRLEQASRQQERLRASIGLPEGPELKMPDIGRKR